MADFTATGRVFDKNGALIAAAGDKIPLSVAKDLGLIDGDGKQTASVNDDGDMIPGEPGPKRTGQRGGANRQVSAGGRSSTKAKGTG